MSGKPNREWRKEWLRSLEHEEQEKQVFRIDKEARVCLEQPGEGVGRDKGIRRLSRSANSKPADRLRNMSRTDTSLLYMHKLPSVLPV